MSKTFQEILSRPVDSVEKPKPRPLGSYYATVSGMPKQKTAKDQNILEYWFKPTGVKALEDPDQAEAASDCSKWAPLSKGFFVDSEDGEWAHRQFLINTLGIDPGPDGNKKSIGQMVAEAPGKPVVITTKHRPYTDSNGEAGIATDIAGVARV